MYLLYHIDYVFEKITLELSFDWRDGWIDLYVCRTVDGKPPPGWAYHEGRLVRIGLAEVLSRGETGDRAAGSQLIKAMRALNQADIPRRKRVERTRSWLLEHLLLLLAATLKETMPRVFALFDAVFDADRGQVSQGPPARV